MHHALPSNRKGHVAAFLGVVVLHGGLMAWQMHEEPPLALPQQQVIRVAMVTPKQPEISPPVAKEIPPPVPPADKGMMKRPEPPEKPRKPEPPKPEKEPEKQQSSGKQAEQATAQHAALTEPVPADYLQNPPPVYPRAALRRHVQGKVLVKVRVSVGGQPLEVALQRSSGHELLDEAALDAVRKWRFLPARRGEELVEASVVVPVEFRIN